MKPVERFRCTAPLRGRETTIVSEILLPFVLLENDAAEEESASPKEWIHVEGELGMESTEGGRLKFRIDRCH